MALRIWWICRFPDQPILVGETDGELGDSHPPFIKSGRLTDISDHGRGHLIWTGMRFWKSPKKAIYARQIQPWLSHIVAINLPFRKSEKQPTLIGWRFESWGPPGPKVLGWVEGLRGSTAHWGHHIVPCLPSLKSPCQNGCYEPSPSGRLIMIDYGFYMVLYGFTTLFNCCPQFRSGTSIFPQKMSCIPPNVRNGPGVMKNKAAVSTDWLVSCHSNCFLRRMLRIGSQRMGGCKKTCNENIIHIWPPTIELQRIKMGTGICR